VHGYIANTDYDWFRFLRGQPGIDEVNFWQPSGSKAFLRISPTEPFFFKLKKPHYAIGGFGLFAHASLLPASLAWDVFDIKNGAESFSEMRARIVRYRSDPIDPHDDPTIGCLLVTQPIFFDDNNWIEQPEDWPKHAVQGKTYNLLAGEGRRVWEECLARSQHLTMQAQPPRLGIPTLVARFGKPVELRPRLGQGSFRIAVLDAYGRSCAVTGEHSLPVLEAAHIRPYTSGGEHALANGLLLRADLHRLFDKGFVTVTPDLTFRVSKRLKELWDNGRVYYELNERPVRLPRHHAAQPDRELLNWHAHAVFAG
jgi:putative restriction endonuclease